MNVRAPTFLFDFLTTELKLRAKVHYGTINPNARLGEDEEAFSLTEFRALPESLVSMVSRYYRARGFVTRENGDRQISIAVSKGGCNMKSIVITLATEAGNSTLITVTRVG